MELSKPTSLKNIHVGMGTSNITVHRQVFDAGSFLYPPAVIYKECHASLIQGEMVGARVVE
jgi:hypothetical protein